MQQIQMYTAQPAENMLQFKTSMKVIIPLMHLETFHEPLTSLVGTQSVVALTGWHLVHGPAAVGTQLGTQYVHN